jgi:2-ketoarginine methyltransferase
VVIALFNVGLFDALRGEGTVDVEAFAADRKLDPDVLRTLCDYLYALKILRKQKERYALDSRGRFLVDVLSGLFYSAHAYEDVLHSLEPLLRQELRYGRDLHRKDEFAARGSGAGGRLFTFPLVIDLIERQGHRTVLDLACGDATFLIDACRRNPAVTAYGVDIAPQALERGRERARAEGLQNRIHLVAEDMFRAQSLAALIGRVDVVTSFYGFQEFLALGREKLLALLQAYREAFPGVTFIVCEIPRSSAEALRRRPGAILEYHLLHSLTHQRLATREEWREIWRDAGARQVEERYLDFARTSIYILRW